MSSLVTLCLRSVRSLNGLEERVDLVVLEFAVAEVLERPAERAPARVLAHHEHARVAADRLGRHDLVGLEVLDDAVLVDAGLVGEGVLADHRLVRRHRRAGHHADHARGAVELARGDLGVVPPHVLAGLERHHHLLERGVAGPLADAVDGALDLRGAGADGRQRVRDGQTEVVVAVRAEVHASAPGIRSRSVRISAAYSSGMP
jgi:hypothetical protein